MKTITIRVDDDLFEEIEKKRCGNSKSDFYRDVLSEYAKSTDEDNMNTSEYNKTNKGSDVNTNEYTILLEKDNTYLKEKVDELVKLLNQEQSLHLQTQQQLPGKVEEKTKRKRWWQFRSKQM
jgi:negative regulator of replication initiation